MENKCHHCGRTFVLETQLRMHVKENHSDANDDFYYKLFTYGGLGGVFIILVLVFLMMGKS